MHLVTSTWFDTKALLPVIFRNQFVCAACYRFTLLVLLNCSRATNSWNERLNLQVIKYHAIHRLFMCVCVFFFSLFVHQTKYNPKKQFWCTHTHSHTVKHSKHSHSTYTYTSIQLEQSFESSKNGKKSKSLLLAEMISYELTVKSHVSQLIRLMEINLSRPTTHTFHEMLNYLVWLNTLSCVLMNGGRKFVL